jgi:ABC-2 type transport system permease protein
MVLCYGLEQAGSLFPAGFAGRAVLSLSIIEHYRSMSRGVIDSRDIVYFIVLIYLFMLFTRFSIERKG